MLIDDLSSSGGFSYEFPVWVVADRPAPPCHVFVYTHERLGKTLLFYTDETAAELTIERAPLVGQVPCRIDKPASLRGLAETLKGQGVAYVGFDFSPNAKIGRFERLADFVARIPAE